MLGILLVAAAFAAMPVASSTSCNAVGPLIDDPVNEGPGAVLCLAYSACWPFCDAVWERVPWDRLP